MDLASARTTSTYARDVSFVSHVNDFIEHELMILEENDFSFSNKEKYLIFREAFGKVKLKKSF